MDLGMHGRKAIDPLRYPAWAVCLAAASLSFLILLACWRPLVADYFPSNDELAIEASSLPGTGADPARTWFTKGFHGLFEPYPEWGSPNTDYFRPVAQAMFRLHFDLFGRSWSSQLVLGYATHAAVVGLVAYLGLAVLRLPGALAALATLAAMLNAAFWSCNAQARFPISYVVQFPIFQTEITCALLCMVAFLAFTARRFAWFAVLTFLALCLKENALTLPFSALALVGCWRGPRRADTVRNAALLLSPFAAWLACKLFVFDYGLAPAAAGDAVPLGGRLVQMLRDALYWPTGIYDTSLRQSLLALRANEWSVVAVHALSLAFNLAWWATIAAAAAHALRHFGRRWLAVAPPHWVAALVFALGNLGLFFLMQDTQLRHGYFWFALGPAGLLGFLAACTSTRALGAALVLGLIVPLLPSIARERSDDALAKYRLLKDASRHFVETLATLPPAVATVYLVDDIVVQPSSPDALARLAGFGGTIVLVNSLDFLPDCPLEAGTALPARTLRRGAQGLDLDYEAAPACFRWAWMVAPERQLAGGPLIERGPAMHYEFPELSRLPVSVSSNKFFYDVGKHWRLHVEQAACPDVEQCRWFTLDPGKSRYVELPQASS